MDNKKENQNFHMSERSFSEHVIEKSVKFDAGKSICETKQFLQEESLNRLTVYEQKKPFKCDTCNENFKDKESLNAHVNSVHEKKNPFECYVCDAHFANKAKLKRHVTSVHENKRRPFKCNTCDAGLVSLQYLNLHIESVHGGKKPYQCKICDTSFASKSDIFHQSMKQKNLLTATFVMPAFHKKEI